MRNFSLLLFFVVLVYSCNKEKKPDVLSQHKMQEVMWDMIRADQYVSELISKDSTMKKKDESIKLYEEIFHVHKVTREKFKQSLDYYSSRPDLFRPIIDSLARRKNDFIPTNTHSAKDSLMRQRFQKRMKKQ